MQLKIKPVVFMAITTACALMLLAQQPKYAKLTSITGIPGEPIAAGTCTTSTSGYLELGGETSGFNDAEFGKAILSALHQGYVITMYPPTKNGIFLNQECHGGAKGTKAPRFP